MGRVRAVTTTARSASCSADPCERRWTALLGRARSRPCATRASPTAATMRSSCSKRRAKPRTSGSRPPRSRCSASCTRRAATTTRPKRRSPKRCRSGATPATTRASPTCCASSACRTCSAASSTRPTRSISEALAAYRNEGNRRGEAWALQNLAWISFSRGDAVDRRAPLAGERRAVRRARRLGRARVGVRAARVRPLQAGPPRRSRRARGADRGRRARDRQPLGRRHDGRAARQRRALARPHARGGPRGSQRDEAVPGHRRPLGRDPGDAPVVRALAELGEREESETCARPHAGGGRQLLSEGMQHIPEVVQANIFLQYGHPDEAAALLERRAIPAAWRSATAITTPRTDCSSCSSVASTRRSRCSNRSTPRRSTTAPR